MKKLGDKDWKVRKEGQENLEALLQQNNNRVKLEGLYDLIAAMKPRLTDPNKGVARAYINFCGKLVEAIGKDFKPQAKIILYPLITNLSDK